MKVLNTYLFSAYDLDTDLENHGNFLMNVFENIPFKVNGSLTVSIFEIVETDKGWYIKIPEINLHNKIYRPHLKHITKEIAHLIINE